MTDISGTPDDELVRIHRTRKVQAGNCSDPTVHEIYRQVDSECRRRGLRTE